MIHEVWSPHRVEALLGTVNSRVESETDSKRHLVREIVIHPDWRYDQGDYDADIAILILEKAAELNAFVRPICLPEHGNDVVVGTGTVVGWTVTENSIGLYEPKASEVHQSVIDGNTCYPTFPRLAGLSSPRMFCGGNPVNQTETVCNGASGGGFYLPNERSIWTMRGIVSGGLKTAFGGCDLNAYTLYTNVAKFRRWITEVMEKSIDWVNVEYTCERHYST